MKKLKLLITFIFIIAALISCDKRNIETFGDPILSASEIVPITIYSDQGGNLACEDLIGDYPGGTTGRINYDAETDAFDADFSDFGLTVTVSGDTYVSFEMDTSSEWCVGAVIVKGGNASNVFYYDPGVKNDQGLTAPINASGSPADLSNITFCFVKCPPLPELIIALKTYYMQSPSLPERWAVTNGIGSDVDNLRIGYIPFNYNEVNYFNLYDYGVLTNPIVGTLKASYFIGLDGKSYMKVIINNEDLNVLFTKTYLYVGSVSTYYAKYVGGIVTEKTYTYFTYFPYQNLVSSNPKEFIIDLSLVN